MSQTHVIVDRLGTVHPLDRINALLARKSNRCAVVFIHGYTGGSGTWNQFQTLLPLSPKGEQQDLYFYKYDGFRSNIRASASIFSLFLDKIFSHGVDVANAHLPVNERRGTDFAYKKIVIVGHSLGAVVSRRAVMSATLGGRAWADKISLVFYAPAHSGSRVGALIASMETQLPFVECFAGTFGFISPLVEELGKDSDSLRILREEVTAARQDGANPHLSAQCVVLAETDWIVYTEPPFPLDPPMPESIPGTGHRTVCKPKPKRLEPLQILEKFL